MKTETLLDDMDRELGLAIPTKVCRRCGKPVRRFQSYCCRECYQASFREHPCRVGRSKVQE